jgi:hypothetical protein
MFKPKSKKQRVLEAFLSGEKHTRFSAEKALHDHCLPTTVSEIQRDYEISVSRKLINVPGYQGKNTQCCLYWVEQDEISRFIEVHQLQLSSKILEF